MLRFVSEITLNLWFFCCVFLQPLCSATSKRQPALEVFVLLAESVSLADGKLLNNVLVIPGDTVVHVVEGERVTEYSRDFVKSILYTDEQAKFYARAFAIVRFIEQIDDMQETFQEFEYQMDAVSDWVSKTKEEIDGLDPAEESERSAKNPYGV